MPDSWPVRIHEFSYLPSCMPYKLWGYRHTYHHPCFYMGPRDLNLEPHDCRTNVLPTEPSPQTISISFASTYPNVATNAVKTVSLAFLVLCDSQLALQSSLDVQHNAMAFLGLEYLLSPYTSFCFASSPLPILYQ